MVQEIGIYIKKRRKELGMTLQQMAEKTGLSTGYLSLMERGINSPTIDNLHKICRAIDTTMIELLSDMENNKLCIKKSERNTYFSAPGKLQYESLIEGNRALVCTNVIVYDDEEHVFDRHIADEFGMIISGALTITVDKTVYEMEEGDAIYIPAGVVHSFHRTGEGECSSIWISPSSRSDREELAGALALPLEGQEN